MFRAHRTYEPCETCPDLYKSFPALIFLLGGESGTFKLLLAPYTQRQPSSQAGRNHFSLNDSVATSTSVIVFKELDEPVTDTPECIRL